MGQIQALARLCADGVTGAVHVAGRPGGTLHLVSGCIGYATSPLVPGVGRLLTAAGKISTEVWDMASAQGPGAAHELLSGGHLTRGELQVCVRSAMIDAAYFILGQGAGQFGFSPHVRHPLDSVVSVPFDVLERELARRDALLAEAWPDARVDSAPLMPVRRLPHRKIILTDVQWELVVNADGRSSPLDLARQLGRSSFAVVLDARRLVAAGMLTAPATPAPDNRGDKPVDKPIAKPVTPVDKPPVARALNPMPRRKPLPDRPWAKSEMRAADAPSTDTLLRVRSSLEKL